MKKKMLTATVCMAMGLALCACKTTNPTGVQNPTGTVTDVTPQPTATPTVMEEAYAALEKAYAALPIVNYDDYVESTVLPEGYLGIEVEKITDEDVEFYVQEVLENNKVRELKDGPLEMGDIAIIDYTGYLDGETFEGGSDVGKELELGSGEFMEGFEEGLVGAKKGDTVTLNLSFPIDYWKTELAGKEVVFEVRINSSAAQVVPEFTDEFVTTLTEGVYTTVDDFRGYAKVFLTEERKSASVMDYLVENTEFGKLNEEYIAAELEFQKLNYSINQFGCSSVEELEMIAGEEVSEVMWAMLEKDVRRTEQERITFYCVAKAENLEVSEDEFVESVTGFAESYGMTYEELVAAEGESALRQSMLMEKALEYLLENVVEVEKGAE